MSPRRTLALLVLAVVAARSPADGVQDFFPVVSGAGADPWVIRHGDYYYLAVTTAENVTLWRSRSLSGIGGGEKKVVWTPPAKGPNSKNVWAPELHRLDGKWYVYYAADDGENENHRMYVLENAADDPFAGEFKDKGKIADPKADRWAIDGTVLTVKGKNYFVWSGWEGATDVRQDLYIAPMKNPWTLAGPRVEISRPSHAWETVDKPTVNEGPQALVRNGAVHLVYSASGAWTDSYCLGRLTLKAGGDPLDPKAWAKHPEPVFQSGNGVVSPGHCSFTKSPDGKEDWLVYHAARHTGAGWERNVRMQKFDWDKDDAPRFGEPASADKLLALPGGDPERQRHEAEGGKLSGGAKAVRRAGASKGGAVDLDAKDGGVEFAVGVKAAGAYTLTVRYANASAKKEAATHTLAVNGRAAGEVECEYTAGNWSAAAVQVDLKAGSNTVRLAAGKPGAVIDCVDVAAGK